MLSTKIKEDEILTALHRLDVERWFEVLDFIGYLNSQTAAVKPKQQAGGKVTELISNNERTAQREEAGKSKRTASRRRKRMTAADMLNSDIVGMWSDREDIGDSIVFTRQLRQQAEHRQRDENTSF